MKNLLVITLLCLFAGVNGQNTVIELKPEYSNNAGSVIRLGRNYLDTATRFSNGKLAITFDEVTESQYTVGFPLFESKNAVATHYLITNQIGTTGKLTWDQISEMQSAEMDIECHSYAHTSFTSLTESQIISDLTKADSTFMAHGYAPPQHHAYPQGVYNEAIKGYVAPYRVTGRGVEGSGLYYPIYRNVDKMGLSAISIDNLSDANLLVIKGYLDMVKSRKSAIILYSHGVSTGGGDYEIPTAKLDSIITYAQRIGIDIVTMSQLYNAMLHTTTVHETVNYTVASTGNGTAVATLKLYSDEDATLTLTGNAKFYTNSGGTAGESSTWWLQRGSDGTGGRTIYVKCTSGTSTLTLPKDHIKRIVSWVALTNAPSLGGDVSALDLDYLSAAGNNTLSGSLAGLTRLTYLYVSGSNTISGSLANLTNLTSLTLTGSNTVSGSIAGLTKLLDITVTGSNTISGAITNLTSLTIMNVSGSNTLSGDISGLTGLTFVSVGGSPTFNGSIAGLTLLQYIACSSPNITVPNVTALTNLSNMNVVCSLTSANVNQILADVWANRDVAKTRTDRTINVRGAVGSGAPTGQGITDASALRLYRTPNNNVSYNLWTITTR